MSVEKKKEPVEPTKEELEEAEEIKRISQMNPVSGCGRDEDRFSDK